MFLLNTEGSTQRGFSYGKQAIADPTKKSEYEAKAQGMKTGYNVAVEDFLHASQIDEINLTGYTGKTGDTIRVRNTDEFKVVQTHVEIYKADSSFKCNKRFKNILFGFSNFLFGFQLQMF